MLTDACCKKAGMIPNFQIGNVATKVFIANTLHIFHPFFTLPTITLAIRDEISTAKNYSDKM